MANTNTSNEESHPTTTAHAAATAVETTCESSVTEEHNVSAAGGGDSGSKVKKNDWVFLKYSVGRSNRGVTWGKICAQGRRQTMEDAAVAYPAFMKLSCNEAGGCTSPDCKYALHKSPVHFFGVFDGHGGPEIQIKTLRGVEGVRKP